MLLWIVGGLILVALVFDYINGFHDAANSIATVVSTRVLSPGQAVIWAAFFNFVAAFTFGTAVAETVGSGMIDVKIVTFAVIFARPDRRDRLGPDHLVLRPADQLVARADRRLRRRGGRQGRLRRDHRRRLDEDAHLHRPVAAHRSGVGFALMTAIFWLFRWMPPSRVDRWFRRLQLVSAAFFSLNHGANDAQKTMGIIAGVLFAAGYIDTSTFRSGWCWRRTPRSASARWPAAGASSTRWARRSPSCSRSAASRRRPARRSRF